MIIYYVQLTSKEEIKNNMQSAINCQHKTYQFNNAMLSLRQVIGQVIKNGDYLNNIKIMIYFQKTFLSGILWSCIRRLVRI